jgi:hypothetical protein
MLNKGSVDQVEIVFTMSFNLEKIRLAKAYKISIVSG